MNQIEFIEKIQKFITIILILTFGSAFLSLIVVTQKQNSDSSQSAHSSPTLPQSALY